MESPPLWATSIINSYFTHRPIDQVQKLYREYGKDGYDYLSNELDYILNARWHLNSTFRSLEGISYLLGKYPTEEYLDAQNLDRSDRMTLFQTFLYQLRIPLSIFPLRLSQIQGLN